MERRPAATVAKAAQLVTVAIPSVPERKAGRAAKGAAAQVEKVEKAATAEMLPLTRKRATSAGVPEMEGMGVSEGSAPAAREETGDSLAVAAPRI